MGVTHPVQYDDDDDDDDDDDNNNNQQRKKNNFTVFTLNLFSHIR